MPFISELHSSGGEHDNCATPYKKEDLSVDKIGISQTSSHVVPYKAYSWRGKT